MATNKSKEGEVNVTVWLPEDLKQQLEELATRSGLSMHAYMREVLINAQRDGLTIARKTELRRTSSGQEPLAAAPPAEGGQIKSTKPQAGSPTRADDKRILDAALESLRKRPPTKGGRE
jgi:plasmid stability protein